MKTSQSDRSHNRNLVSSKCCLCFSSLHSHMFKDQILIWSNKLNASTLNALFSFISEGRTSVDKENYRIVWETYWIWGIENVVKDFLAVELRDLQGILEYNTLEKMTEKIIGDIKHNFVLFFVRKIQTQSLSEDLTLRSFIVSKNSPLSSKF